MSLKELWTVCFRQRLSGLRVMWICEQGGRKIKHGGRTLTTPRQFPRYVREYLILGTRNVIGSLGCSSKEGLVAAARDYTMVWLKSVNTFKLTPRQPKYPKTVVGTVEIDPADHPSPSKPLKVLSCMKYHCNGAHCGLTDYSGD